MTRPAIFLDRDGTLNVQAIRDGKPYSPMTVDEFRLCPGVPEGCRALKAAGFTLVVATNQPDVGRGALPQAAVEAMHAKLLALVPEIDRIEVCYYPGAPLEGPAPSGPRPTQRSALHEDSEARRRKPEPGMLLDAASALGLDLARSWMVGDRWRDVDCGRRAGVRTVFIDFGYAEELKAQPEFKVKSFAEAVEVIRLNASVM